ncbi:hypothetical protein FDUTEX481_01926 [Tolypothrix sp. PCC 7601]|nr:hypothetical protein FDUTEX481_01926 [Tolypothrix sp. PCC 7601]
MAYQISYWCRAPTYLSRSFFKIVLDLFQDFLTYKLSVEA